MWSNDGWISSAGNLVRKYSFSSLAGFIFRARVLVELRDAKCQTPIVVRWLLSHQAGSNLGEGEWLWQRAGLFFPPPASDVDDKTSGLRQ